MLQDDGNRKANIDVDQCETQPDSSDNITCSTKWPVEYLGEHVSTQN